RSPPPGPGGRPIRVRARSRRAPPMTDPERSIPRRIIQTGKSRDLPPPARASARMLQLLHPDWDYMFFDDEDVRAFIALEYPQHRGLFETFPHPIQRYDLFRYLAVLRFGGFYFDLDVMAWQPLDALRAHGCVFP